ncbi:MAG TPA: phosphoketolase family protein, partial [Candidatus Gracilibacteria bacterium]|nr:phosphoketolase family protein [Candidatus Gracilibacteria bacterium]
YEAFCQVVASMADQYAKFIKASQEVAWRKPLPPMNIILTSLLERQDHNGFSHQNPSFISSMMEKHGNFVSAYFPPDLNSMIYALETTMKSTNALNLIVAGKNELPYWLNPAEAKQQVDDGIMTWDFASDPNPELILCSTGDYVTQEALAAVKIFKSLFAKIPLRYVNVSELSALGIGDATTVTNAEFLNKYFTQDKPVVYNYHGYPQTIKKLLFDYHGNERFHIHGYEENGSTTTPFDMKARNATSRYHLVIDLVQMTFRRNLISEGEMQKALQKMQDKLQSSHEHILRYDIDPEEIANWKW